MTTTSHCGPPLPLTITLDFDAYTARPADIAPPANMTLALKNKRNRRAEKDNGESLDDTFAYQEDLHHQTAASFEGDFVVDHQVTQPIVF
ncbi:hypothetical protein B0H13DRAFT_2321861 [Mycena leptocephala]|nr:hypothetical protein B0H13DRAFT_2321861 [Mycena leptocephala]